MISKTRLIILETNKLDMFHSDDLQQHLNLISIMITKIDLTYEPRQVRYLLDIKKRLQDELAERELFANSTESNINDKRGPNENIFNRYYRFLRSILPD